MIIQDPIDKTIREATPEEEAKLIRTEGVTHESIGDTFWVEHHLDGLLVKRDARHQLK